MKRSIPQYQTWQSFQSLLTKSALVMPMPVSRIERTLFSSSGVIRIYSSLSVSRIERRASDLVEGIRGVGDELAQKYPLVGVEDVFEGVSDGHDKNAFRHTDDEIEELTDLSLESEAFRLRSQRMKVENRVSHTVTT
jgi:hypothetical protein